MKALQIQAPGVIKEIERIEQLTNAGDVKFRVLKVLITESDLRNYLGISKTPKYPIIPGRFAVGMVDSVGSESHGLTKGTKIFINPVSPCKACNACMSNNPDQCSDLQTASVNKDGYLCDFVIHPAGLLYELPKTVSEEAALYTSHVALSLKIMEKLKIEKGSHVVIVGANLLGNILAQICHYYKAVPIVIDKNETKLEAVKNKGIYYTLNSEDGVNEKINEITGGRFAEKVVFITNSGENVELAAQISAYGGAVCFSGFCYESVNINFSTAIKKQLNVYSLCSCAGKDKILSALNALANNALNIEGLSKKTVTYEQSVNEIADMAELFKQKKNKAFVVDLIKF